VQIGLVLALCLGAASVEATEGKLRDGIRPVVFVHGGSGSGAQFESQALRFASNGYPDSFIRVLEYDSSSIGTILPQVLARLDALIAEIQAETGFQQVDLVGHSLGTVVSQAFLASPLRAANVAHYVNVDGRVAGAPPGGVATLALFAGAAREVQGEIVGATNITLEDQEHVEAVTSPEAFVEMFRFFTGRSPRTSRIVPALLPFFPVSGRAVLFPQNDGVAGSLVLVFEVNPRTGQRKRGLLSRTALPEAIFAIDESGEFGPFRARRGAHYEFALLRDGARPHSFYFEPFLRRDRLVRLNTANEGEGIGRFVPQSDATSAVSISRNKEFRGDRDRDSDRLFIEGTNILNETTAPSGFVGAPVAFFAFDALLDGASNLTVLPPPFALIPFINAVDLVLPADERKTIDIVTVPRGRLLATRRIRVPARPSSEARISVQLNDFER
jgi:pimeloyl-ACP methyl ester carboxylesterase